MLHVNTCHICGSGINSGDELKAWPTRPAAVGSRRYLSSCRCPLSRDVSLLLCPKTPQDHLKIYKTRLPWFLKDSKDLESVYKYDYDYDYYYDDYYYHYIYIMSLYIYIYFFIFLFIWMRFLQEAENGMTPWYKVLKSSHNFSLVTFPNRVTTDRESVTKMWGTDLTADLTQANKTWQDMTWPEIQECQERHGFRWSSMGVIVAPHPTPPHQ